MDKALKRLQDVQRQMDTTRQESTRLIEESRRLLSQGNAGAQQTARPKKIKRR